MFNRDFKGSSIFEIPDDYVVIDIETTGLSPEYDSIIEVAAIKYASGKEIDRFSSLIRPQENDDGLYIDDFISNLTGITNEMLASADDASSVLPKYNEFIGDYTLIGHNVNFDINFLYDNFNLYLSKPLKNNFIDTMRISRNLHPEETHHRLKDLTKKYSIPRLNEHRALEDCIMTHSVLCSLLNEISTLYSSYNSFLSLINERHKKKTLKSSDICTDKTEFDVSHPLYQKVCVFTGTLEKMIRREAMQLVVDHGGINGDSVTKKTNYLILGNNDYCKSIKDGKSSKQKKAEKLKLEGLDIEIISENVFYDMIEDLNF